ncbi:DUF47 domain-containing protein [Pseudactinotalea sp.]|uniref:DUF47 domain-containing protein n=1 Tax=Pseudactinotalea sp. TaxID=1926260 RepID=UPI003B3B55FC
MLTGLLTSRRGQPTAAGQQARGRRERRQGRRDRRLAAPLSAQVQAAREGAALALAMARREVLPAQARTRIAEIERRGDAERAAVIVELSRALAPPLDREDLFRLSRTIDDVLDTLRDFLREADLYRIEDRGSYAPMLEGIVAALDLLDDAMQVLWTSPRDLPLAALRVKKSAAQVARLYQSEFARLVSGEVDPTTLTALKKRELTKRLDWVASHVAASADGLSDGALKRGY